MKRKKSLSITVEIVLLNICFILLFAMVISIGSSRIFNKVMRQQMETLIGDTCSIAKEYVDGNLLGEYLDSNGKSEKSINSLKLLQTICDATKFNYLYLIQVDLENQKVINLLSVHGSMYPELKTYDCGQISDITSDTYHTAYRQILNGEKESAFVYRIVPDSNFYRHHITGLAPVLDSNGNITGIMCAEVTMAWYRAASKYYLTYFIALIAFMIGLVIIANNLLLEHRIIIPFLKIKKETERFSLNATLNENTLSSTVNRRNELGQLAESIDLMEDRTLQYVSNIAKMAAEKESNEIQLKIATQIQLGALPKPITIEGVELYAIMKPALEVGGDFYDFFMIDEKHVGFVIADVSGKGVPAALFMMVTKIILGKNLKSGMGPAQALYKTNMELCEKNPVEMFVTCLCGILNTETFELVLANAGHVKPAIVRKGNAFELQDVHPCFVLGGISGIKYKEQIIQMAPGDALFMYTDGIPEAINSKEEEFGNDRMLEVLNSSKDESLENICTGMQKAISEYNGTVPQFDDITMLTFRIRDNS